MRAKYVCECQKYRRQINWLERWWTNQNRSLNSDSSHMDSLVMSNRQGFARLTMCVEDWSQFTDDQTHQHGTQS